MAAVALAFAVLRAPGGSATELGLTLAVRATAQLACLLAGGVIADRLPPHRVMVGSNLLAAAAQGSLAILFLLRAVPLGVLLFLGATNGAASALFLPASTALLPSLVPASQLNAANATLRLGTNGASIMGAGLAGAVVVTVGPDWALVLDAVSFLVSAALLAGLRGIRTTPRPGGGAASHFLRDLRDGWREVITRVWLWTMITQLSVVNACLRGIDVLGPQLAMTRLGGPLLWSAVTMSRTIGMFIGSALAVRLRPSRPLYLAALMTFGFVPSFFALAAEAPVWILIISMLLLGACSDVFGVLWDTTVQGHIPADLLSRVCAFDWLGSFALGPLAMAAVGPVSSALGPGLTLAAAGAVAAVANSTVLLVRPVRLLPPVPKPGTG